MISPPVEALRIAIGVRVTHPRQKLRETLLAICETAGRAISLTVLCDLLPDDEGIDEVREAAGRVEIIAVPQPGGGAASLNRLLAANADIYVMIEAGARPAPQWLDRMIAALYSTPDIGAVGPSTNWCWNDQAAPECRDIDAASLGSCATALQSRYGDRTISMGPTHNLADFAFAIRRSMVDKIGLADESYADFACWEMDYWARAALAGFRCAWAQSALVWRDRPIERAGRCADATLHGGKLRYQSQFCTLANNGKRIDALVCDHCFGSACSAFTRRKFPSHAVRHATGSQDATRGKNGLPLISCVMPTRGRPEYVAQAVRYFERQNYANRELVIVFERDEDLPANLDPQALTLIRTDERSIGAKREIGTKAASGGIIAHWDDDDWFSADRLSRQAAPIIAGLCDISGLTNSLFFQLEEQRFWKVTPPLYARLFVEGVLGGTLMFTREMWERFGPYPDISLREDIAIMVRAMKHGARLARVEAENLYTYLRHGRNSWTFAEGLYLDPSGWSLADPPEGIREDLEFYARQRDRISKATTTHAAAPQPTVCTPARSAAVVSSHPLVSCIMPTRDRPHLVAKAIEQFQRQDYPNRELIVLDNGSVSVEHFAAGKPHVRYFRSGQGVTLGELRNVACSLADGSLIAHWDDDDWMAPGWLASQVECLQQSRANVVGLNAPLFHDQVSGAIWRYVYRGLEPWVAGGTLLYQRELWERNRFPAIAIGEDNRFLWSPAAKRLATNPRSDLYVARIHAGNTSPKITGGRRWHRIEDGEAARVIDQTILADLFLKERELSRSDQ